MKWLVALALCALPLCAAQGFGGGGGGGGGATATAAPPTAAPTSNVNPTTAATPLTTVAPSLTAAPAGAQEPSGKATLGALPEGVSCEATPVRKAVNVVFSYTDLFAEAAGRYCCPHRTSSAVINGTGRAGVWYAGDADFIVRTDPNTAYYPATVIGSAVLTDSPFALGLTLTLDSALFAKGNIVTLWLYSFLKGTCTGALNAAGEPTCLLRDAVFPSNGVGLFASAMVPLDGSQLVLSGFSAVPNAALGITSTVDYEFQFRVSDNGPPSRGGPSAFAMQWNSRACSVTTCPDRSSYMVRFPPRAPAPVH